MKLLSIFALTLLGLLAAVPSFKPPELTAAGEILYPLNSVADGVVVLQATTSRTGKVVATSVLRDIPSLTAPSLAEVQSWRFRPAERDGQPAASTVTVALAFRPAVNFAAPPSFQAAHGKSDSGYTPAGFLAVSYPDYPVNSVATGTVVLEVALDAAGGVTAVRTVRSFTPFTEFALRAVKTWRFEAALWNGKPIATNAVVAFVFRPPLVSP